MSPRLAEEEIDSKVAALRLQLESANQVAAATEQGYAVRVICANCFSAGLSFLSLQPVCLVVTGTQMRLMQLLSANLRKW